MYVVAKAEMNGNPDRHMKDLMRLGDSIRDDFGISYTIVRSGKGLYLVIDDNANGKRLNFRTKDNAYVTKSIAEKAREFTLGNGHKPKVTLEQSAFDSPALMSLTYYRREQARLSDELGGGNISQPEYQSRIAQLRERHGIYPASMFVP